MGFTRYVAIGDSQTEGLWDGDDTTGLAGFADRLAIMVDDHYPGLLYANLAVRGRRVAEVLEEQLPGALSMQPDLVTVCVGMNDVIRPGRSFGRALADLDELYVRLARSGTTVATTTFPDITRILPIGRLLATRVERINGVIAAAARRHGFALVDLYRAESMTDPATWSPDRVHGSAHGHRLFAEAAAEALQLPGSNHDWAGVVGVPAGRSSLLTVSRSQLLWTQNMLMPWLWRHLRGVSSGDGRAARRPQLQPVPARSAARPGGVEALGDVDDLRFG